MPEGAQLADVGLSPLDATLYALAEHIGWHMPDIDALIAELFAIRGRLVRYIDGLHSGYSPQVIVLRAAVHDIDCAIKAYRISGTDQP
jgi:hypothetical protein